MTPETMLALREGLLLPPVAALLLLPGIGPAWVFARRRRLSAPWMLSLAFAWSVAWCSAAAAAAHLVGLPLNAVILAYVAAIVGSLVLVVMDWRKRGRPHMRRRDLGGVVVALGAALVALAQGPWWFGTTDNFYHLAASRSLIAKARPIVTDPFFGLDVRTPDSTSGMWNTISAVVARSLRVDVATPYAAMTAFSAFAVMLAFWLLAREVSRKPWAATVATVAYFVAAWYTDMRAFGFPNKISIALLFTTLALLVRCAAQPHRRWMLAIGVTGLAGLAVHLASGELELLCAAGVALALGALALVRTAPGERRVITAAAARVLGGIGLMVLPLSPILALRVSAVFDSGVMGEDSFVWAGEQLLSGPFGIRFVTPGGFDFGGPWLFWLTLALGILAAAHAVRTGDRRSAALVPLVLLAHVISALPPVSTLALNLSSYMVARLVELCRFAPYLALAWGFGFVGTATERRLGRALALATLIAALVSAVPYLRSTYVQGEGIERRGAKWSVAEARERDMRKVYGFEEISVMRTYVGNSYPRVAADADSSYHLMGLVPVAVVCALPTHTPVFMSGEELRARNTDMERFFSSEATRQERIEILKRWDIDYVFVREYLNGVVTRRAIDDDDELFKLIVRNDRILFLQVNRDALERLAES